MPELVRPDIKEVTNGEYEGRKLALKQIEFYRTAANSEFDLGKFTCHDKTKKDKWLLRFKLQGDDSFQTMLRLCNDEGQAQTIADIFCGYFSRCPISYDKELIPDSIKASIEKNFDGCGTSFEHWCRSLFREALIVPKPLVYTNRSKDVNGGLPYTNIIPRENLLHYAKALDTFKFIKWQEVVEEVVGLTVTKVDRIYFQTPEYEGYAERRGKSWELAFFQPNPVSIVTMHEVCVGDVPMIDPIASLQYNLFNLDAEERKILREISGGAFLNAEKGIEIEGVVGTTVIYREKGYEPVTYEGAPNDSIDAHEKYAEAKNRRAYEHSRLRVVGKESNQPEPVGTRRLNFLDAEAVITTIAQEIERVGGKAISDQIKFQTLKEVPVKVTIVTDDIIPSVINELVQTVLAMEGSSTIPKSFTAHFVKTKLADKLGVPEELRAEADEEDEEEEPADASKTLIGETEYGEEEGTGATGSAPASE